MPIISAEKERTADILAKNLRVRQSVLRDIVLVLRETVLVIVIACFSSTSTS